MPTAAGNPSYLVTLLFLVVAAAISLASAPSSQARQELPQCARTVVDYLSPFQNMRDADPPPDGPLNFGPKSLRLEETGLGQGQLIVGGRGTYGYRATLDEKVASSAVALRWRVTAMLLELRPSGKVKRVVRSRRWHIQNSRDLHGLTFALKIRGIALYRYVLKFHGTNGNLLRRYSQYVRGVSRTLKSAIFMDGDTYSPGDQARIQLVNLGTETILFGAGGVVSSFRNGEWAPVFKLPSRGKRRLTALGPGEGSLCESVLLPEDLSAGLYRVEKPVSFLLRDGSRNVVQSFSVG